MMRIGYLSSLVYVMIDICLLSLGAENQFLEALAACEPDPLSTSGKSNPLLGSL